MRMPFGSDMGYVDELTKEFLAESLEGLDRMDRCLTDLEHRPGDKELLGEIFRSVHTIKGTTGFLGFARLEKLAHAGESLLGTLRDGTLVADANIIGGLLELMDGLREILRLIERTGKEGTRAGDQDSTLIALMERLNHPVALPAEAVAAQAQPVLLAPETALVSETALAFEAVIALEAVPAPEAERRTERSLACWPAAGAVSADKTLRVGVDVLNRMMNLVGELVLTRNQIVQSGRDAANFPELARRLNSVTADLRETVMQARMQPVGHLFGKFPRLVRDLALSCGKLVSLEFSGQDTGLDKSLLEAVKDPLTHAVRNAIDHGLEDPAARAAAGKSPEGVVHLSAHHHNGFVVIEVEDDGGGIAIARVLSRAIEHGLITEERARAMSEREALQLVFHPGFSTASKVTHISGRGVGMDVVLANVKKVGGTVELESREGIGTLLRLRVPLTLAIVRALVVRSGRQSFCLPQSSLAELVCVSLRDAATSIEWIGDCELFRLRDRLLPIVRLDRMLGMEGEGMAERTNGFYLVVLESEGGQYGLMVDDLMTPEEIVVKPLSPMLREIGVFSGATVLGNGSLAMILDLTAITQRAGIKASATADGVVLSRVPPAARAASSFLLFEDFRTGERPGRRALPLTHVERIESVAVREIEFAAGLPMLPYRGELLALEDRAGLIDELLDSSPDSTITVLICQRPGPVGEGRGAARVGLTVRRVLEVADGSVVEKSAEICSDHLALVNDRLTVVHQAFAQQQRWRDVA